MSAIRTGWVLLITLILSLLVLAFSSQQKACLDSDFLSEVKWHLRSGESQVILSCRRSRKATPVDPAIFQKTVRLEKDLRSLNYFLNSVRRKPLQYTLHVSEGRPSIYQVQGSTLFLGSSQMIDKKNLYKIVIRGWLEEVMELKAAPLLYREALAEILYYLFQGELALQPDQQWQPRAWHETLMTLTSYCKADTRYRDHDEFCESVNQVSAGGGLGDGGRELNDLTLAYYLKTVWIRAFQAMNLQDRAVILRSFPKYMEHLRAQNWDYSELTLDAKIQTMISEFLIRPFEQPEFSIQSEHKLFLSNLLFELREFGFEQNLAVPKLDVLYKRSGILKQDGPLLSQLRKLAKSPSSIFLAVMDDEGLWIPPYNEALPRGIFGSYSAQTLVTRECGALSGELLTNLSAVARHVIYVRDCDLEKDPPATSLFFKDAGDFAQMNLDFPLVMVNSEEAQARKDLLRSLPNLVKVLEERKTDDFFFQSLAWKSLEWEPHQKVYRPISDHPLIEMYR